MQDINKKRGKKTFQLTEKNPFFFLNCSSVKKQIEILLLRDLKGNCLYLKKNIVLIILKKYIYLLK